MMTETIIVKQQLKIPSTLKALVEALIFAAQEPLSLAQLKAIYTGEGKNDEARQIETETIRQVVADLNKEFEKASKSYRIVSVAGGYQFATLSEYAEWLGRLYREQGRRKLSQSGLETLAIIAYKQPITKSEVEKIRGVNCDYVLRTLLEKELIGVTGRAESVGRPLLYGTTKEFLKHFGLNDITDLPRPREIEEILGESQFETERRMLEAQAGAEEMQKEQEEFKSRLPHIPKKKIDLEEKEASILPRRTAREISIVPNETTAQEAIEFKPDTEGEEKIVSQNAKQESADAIPLVNSGDPLFPSEVKNELTETELIPEGMQAVSAETEIVLSGRENFEEKINVPDPEIIAEQEYPDTIRSETSDQKIEAEQKRRQITGDETLITRMDEHGKKAPRWKLWKEKIQGFIKKLFD
jgi:segregation and condensation protein B